MNEFSFEKYMEAAAAEEARRRSGGRPRIKPILPQLEIPEAIVQDQITRPGPEASQIAAEAELVAGAMRHSGVSFDQYLQLRYGDEEKPVGAWSLDPPATMPFYDLKQASGVGSGVRGIPLKPALLSEEGAIYFSFQGLHYDIGADGQPETILDRRSLGEGTAANEQIRYGLARFVGMHELALAV